MLFRSLPPQISTKPLVFPLPIKHSHSSPTSPPSSTSSTPLLPPLPRLRSYTHLRNMSSFPESRRDYNSNDSSALVPSLRFVSSGPPRSNVPYLPISESCVLIANFPRRGPLSRRSSIEFLLGVFLFLKIFTLETKCRNDLINLIICFFSYV